MELKWNFLANTSAMQFYKHIGCVVVFLVWNLLNLFIFTYHRFHVDPCSPTYIEEEDDMKEELDPDDESDVDYDILSRIIQ